MTKILSENVLRKTQAAIIVANALGYTPEEGSTETPEEIIEHALEAADNLTPEQQKILDEMLRLSESIETDDDISDDELDSIIRCLDDDDFLHAYDPEELAVIDPETGEEVDKVLSEDVLNEVLSRTARIKMKNVMNRSKTKRETKARIALRKHSSTQTLNHRARRMAVKAMELKLAKNKPLSSLSIGEKERIERIIARRKVAINRLAMKLVPRVRSIEKNRLAHHTFTQ